MEDKQDLYIGKEVDPETGELKEKYLYRTRDLTTHALIIGMTGSGKTGLGIVTLEETILDGIPVLAIDPKGDLTNLLLTFPGLKPSGFKPWVDPAQTEMKGLSVDAYAENLANLWQKGLSDWEIPPERLLKLKEAADYTIFTPGSTAGVPVSALQSFKRPEKELGEEEVIEKIKGIATALLGLIGIEADPVKSREHILISTILQNAWQSGSDLSIEDLIMQVQKPPFSKLGVFSVDSFFPPEERAKLSMQINSLIASPAFQTWLSGEPLSIEEFIRKGDKPRVSIFYIAHLSDSERMFFVTLLLGELISWMRMQPGTDSPRLILYFDEIFGYFPPYPKDPPSKYPMLTLMKQARAFGISVILATQNPVDIDYKGLTNAGTWFLGKLQQERDKERVMSGLEGTFQESGKSLDRGYFDRILGSLKPRVFLLHNIHATTPKVITSRWAMNYLRGPLTKAQVGELMAGKKSSVPLQAMDAVPPEKKQYLPEFPPEIPVLYETNRGPGPYFPYLYLEGEALFKQETAGIYAEKSYRALLKVEGEIISGENFQFLDHPPATEPILPEGATVGEIPGYLHKKDFLKKTHDQFKQVVKAHEEKYYYSSYFKLYSRLGESREDFLRLVEEKLHQVLSGEMERSRIGFEQKMLVFREKLRRVESKKMEAEAELKAISTETTMDIGVGVISILMGKSGRGSLRRAGSSVTKREKAKLKRDQAKLEIARLNSQLMEMEARAAESLRAKEEELRAKAASLEERMLRPSPSSITIKYAGILFR